MNVLSVSDLETTAWKSLSLASATFTVSNNCIWVFPPLLNKNNVGQGSIILLSDMPMWYNDYNLWLHNTAKVSFVWKDERYTSVSEFCDKFFTDDVVRNEKVLLAALTCKFSQHPTLGMALVKLGDHVATRHGGKGAFLTEAMPRLLARVRDDLKLTETLAGTLLHAKITSTSNKVSGSISDPKSDFGKLEDGHRYYFLGRLLSKILSTCRKQQPLQNIGFKLMRDGPAFSYVFDDVEEGRYLTISLQTYLIDVVPKVSRTLVNQLMLEGMAYVRESIKKKLMNPWDPNVEMIEGAIFPASGNTSDFTSPMLATNGKCLEDLIEQCKKRKFTSIFLQPKLDGVRLMMHMKEGKLVAFTRGGNKHDIGDEFAAEATVILNKLEAVHGPGIILDGELYIHSVPLGMFNVLNDVAGSKPNVGNLVPMQVGKINGAAASYELKGDTYKRNKPLIDVLEYHVFTWLKKDVPMPAFERWTELKKYITLDTLGADHWTPVGNTWTHSGPRIWLVPGVKFDDQTRIEAALKMVMSKNYEGIMVYNPDAPYEHKRSTSLIKLKTTETEWFQIVGIEPEKNGLESANLIYRYGNSNYVSSGFFSNEMKREFYDAYVNDPEKYTGMWAYIRFQKITEHTGSQGALRDPKILRISETPEKD